MALKVAPIYAQMYDYIYPDPGVVKITFDNDLSENTPQVIQEGIDSLEDSRTVIPSYNLLKDPPIEIITIEDDDTAESSDDDVIFVRKENAPTLPPLPPQPLQFTALIWYPVRKVQIGNTAW